MITYLQAIILGLLQGITELFPISSLGHSVIFPTLFEWHINQKDPGFLSFLVATHFATALVLFLVFWKDWLRILKGVYKSLKEREIKDPDAKLGWVLVVGTLPAGLLAALFQDNLQAFFASATFAATFLVGNGIMLFGAELLRRKKAETKQDSDVRISKISWLQAIGVGTAQAIALLPGFSRTGATLTGGLLVGLSHEDSVKYSFLLATPIIAAAALVKLPDLAVESNFIWPSIVGALAAGVAAYFSVRFLTRYFKTNNLYPFALYCILFGGIFLLLFR